jgi:hypothetical protein
MGTTDVLSAVPDICRAEFLEARRGMTLNGRCSRVRRHRGSHFDVILGFVWLDHSMPRVAWQPLDADDLTLHFECRPQCPWSPRPC